MWCGHKNVLIAFHLIYLDGGFPYLTNMYCYVMFMLCICFRRTFVATASRIIRPDTIYRVSVAILPESTDLTVRALITKGRHQVASDTQVFDSGSSHHLLLKVSQTRKTSMKELCKSFESVYRSRHPSRMGNTG